MFLRNSVLVLLLNLGLCSCALAMRCGDRLVYEGDTQFNVLTKCGEPLYRQVYEQSAPIFNAAGYQVGYGTSTVETWIYQKSSADFQYELIFNAGVLQSINANRNP
ncbi:DUF2845 domain-containing protein [uncultured Legionella sp.]|uniref:DUF2845 domain-containing protein n=1 Tax=uncultured Legionella sp. TaxID=210934 RepID=UPI00261E7FA0|nr:DUF2845 domain-containing protein [uncultured Legionella sp.]